MTTTVQQSPTVERARLIQESEGPAFSQGVPSRDVLLRRYARLKIENETRNSTYRHLLRLYENDPEAHGMTGVTDQMELIINRFFDTVNSFVDFMGIPPNIHFFPPNLTPEGKRYADEKEKYLYALWDYNLMDKRWPRMMFDECLYGTAYGGVLPSVKNPGLVEYRRFTPANFYPQVVLDTGEVTYYFYENRKHKDDVLARWPHAKLGSASSAMWQMVWPDGSLQPNECIVLEYCDDEWLIYFVNDEIVESVHHKFGFCPAEIFENIVKPDIIGGVSTVATYEHLQTYESELYSMLADIIAYWAEPMMVVESDQVDASKIHRGGVTVVEKGGKVYFVEPSIQVDTIGDQAKRTASAFRDGTMPDVLYGKVESKGALGSGPVLSGLQTKFMVRLHSLYRRNGCSLVNLNTKALRIARQVFKNKRIQTVGWKKNRYFELDMYGRDIQEYLRHRVFWDSSVTDPDRHLVMELQKHGQKLQSKYRTQENLGLSPQDENELIRQEDIYDIKKQAALTAETGRLQAQFQQRTIEGTNRDVLSARKGATEVYPREGREKPGPGRPQKPGIAGGERAAPSNALSPERVVAALRAVQKLRGAVYLAQVTDRVFVAVTDKQDKGTILKAPSMAQFKGLISFIVIQPGQTKEDWIPIAGVR